MPGVFTNAADRAQILAAEKGAARVYAATPL